MLDAVRRNFYVKNCLNSVNSGLEVIGSINELIMDLRRGRFEWLSNCLAVSFDVSVSCADSTVSTVNGITLKLSFTQTVH